MVGELGYQHLREKARRRDAVVDDLRGDWRLRERLAVLAHPLATDVTFDRKDARQVVQLLADVLADAFQAAAAAARRERRFVVDIDARQLGRQPHSARRLWRSGLGAVCPYLARHAVDPRGYAVLRSGDSD